MDGTPEYAAAGVVLAEAEAVRRQDIDRLAELWLPAGVLVDANQTADDPGDDRRWEGWTTIRDRYVHEIFPYYREPEEGPRPRQSLPVATVTGDRAEVAVAASDGQTTQQRWSLEWEGGEWRIAGLTYNLAPVFATPTGG